MRSHRVEFKLKLTDDEQFRRRKQIRKVIADKIGGTPGFRVDKVIVRPRQGR